MSSKKTQTHCIDSDFSSIIAGINSQRKILDYLLCIEQEKIFYGSHKRSFYTNDVCLQDSVENISQLIDSYQQVLQQSLTTVYSLMDTCSCKKRCSCNKCGRCSRCSKHKNRSSRNYYDRRKRYPR